MTYCEWSTISVLTTLLRHPIIRDRDRQRERERERESLFAMPVNKTVNAYTKVIQTRARCQ